MRLFWSMQPTRALPPTQDFAPPDGPTPLTIRAVVRGRALASARSSCPLSEALPQRLSAHFETLCPSGDWERVSRRLSAVGRFVVVCWNRDAPLMAVGARSLK